MKYLIYATNTEKFRTKTGWVSNETELFDNEKMLSFDSRLETDVFIKKYRFLNCQSFGIIKGHPLFKHC